MSLYTGETVGGEKGWSNSDVTSNSATSPVPSPFSDEDDEDKDPPFVPPVIICFLNIALIAHKCVL
jgi:hypothetical protein